MTLLSQTDRRLLNLIQTDFPLIREPYADLGQHLGESFGEVIRQISDLKRAGIIRLIGPVVDARSLGYSATLVAMRVTETNLEKAESVISSHPGVSHGYERDHYFNVWFTLAVSPTCSIDEELQRLADLTGAEDAFSLPVTRLFKIGAYFDMDDTGRGPRGSHGRSKPAGVVRLSALDRVVLNELQQDLPMTSQPFLPMAEKVGVGVDRFLGVSRSLMDRGAIRRFSASINHRRAGFVANAMTCWRCPPDQTDMIGQRLALLREVSHCYERKTNDLWPYNMFAMVHGRSREVCSQIVERISRETGLAEYAMLYSTKEFKKARVTYVV